MGASDERYRTLLESITDSVYILDREWRRVLVNEAATRFTGIPREKLLGAKLTEQFPDIEETSFFRTFKRVMDTRIADSVVDEYTFPDGRTGWQEVHVYPVPEGILCISRDITERKKQEESLKRAEEQFRNLVENSPNAISVTLGPEIVYANQKRVELTGHSNKTELIGTNGLDHVAHEDKEMIQRTIQARQRGEEVPIIQEFRLIKQDGIVAQVIDYVSEVNWQGQNAVLHVLEDVTERKRMEEELRESEERYRHLIEVAPDAITTMDMKGIITSANAAALRLTGHSENEIVGKHFSKLGILRMRDLPQYMKLFGSMLKGEVPEAFEVAFTHKEGTPTWAEINVAFLEEGGKKTGFEIISRDITERKMMELVLQKSNEEKMAILEGSPDAIVVNDDEKLIYLNQRAVVLFGYERPSELIGQPFIDLFTPKHKEIIRKRAKERLAGGTPPSLYEVEVLNRDGVVVPVKFQISVINFDNEPAILNIIRDITERKQMEEALRKSEKQASAAIEAARALTFSYDIATGKVDWGGAVEDITGYTQEEFAKVDVDGWADRLHPDDREEVLSILQEAMGKDRATAEYRFKTKKGYVILSSISLTEKENGKAVRLVGILQDITERRKLEKERDEAFREGTIYASKDVRNKIIMAYQAAHLSEQGGLEHEEALNSVKNNLKAAIDVIDNLLFGLEKQA